MLTGLYELENCTSFSWHKREVSAELGVAAEIMAVLNIPIGASEQVNRSYGHYIKQTFMGKSIWAAEYQLIDAKFIRVPSRERSKPAPQLQLPLQLKAIYSDATWRGEAEEEELDNMAVLGLADSYSSGEGDASDNEQEFWERFAEAEEDWRGGFDIDE